METLIKKINLVDDWAEQYAIRDQFVEEAGAMLEALQAAVAIAVVAEEVDQREKRSNDILYALSNEPMSVMTANELLRKLAELEASTQVNPPEFGSAEWFESVEPIAF